LIRIHFRLDDNKKAPADGIALSFPNWKSVWYGKTWFAGETKWRDHKFGKGVDLGISVVVPSGESEVYVDVLLSEFCDDSSLLNDDDFGI
jgi:hypothetical protein